ncbi:MAG: MFS transporter [Rubrivivax sp.]|nr:MAG: MFS transporter [Rubrivivax sp.]
MMSGRDEFRMYWPTVLAAFVGIALGIASVPFYILGPLMKPLQSAFGWSMDGLMLCASLVATGVTISSPYAGRLADRHDARLLVAGSMVMLAISYILASQVRGAMWQFQAIYFFMGFVHVQIPGNSQMTVDV